MDKAKQNFILLLFDLLTLVVVVILCQILDKIVTTTTTTKWIIFYKYWLYLLYKAENFHIFFCCCKNDYKMMITFLCVYVNDSSSFSFIVDFNKLNFSLMIITIMVMTIKSVVNHHHDEKTYKKKQERFKFIFYISFLPFIFACLFGFPSFLPSYANYIHTNLHPIWQIMVA